MRQVRLLVRIAASTYDGASSSHLQFYTTASIPLLVDLCHRHGVDCASPHTNARVIDDLIAHFIEPLCVDPTFLYNHPTCMSPLAKAHRTQPGVTERFELFVAGKELCNAYTELNDPFDQRQRFAAQQQVRTTWLCECGSRGR